MQSTFPSTMADSMSGDELSLHLGRQVALQNEKYKEPEPAVEVVYNNYNWFSDLSRTMGVTAQTKAVLGEKQVYSGNH